MEAEEIKATSRRFICTKQSAIWLANVWFIKPWETSLANEAAINHSSSVFSHMKQQGTNNSGRKDWVFHFRAATIVIINSLQRAPGEASVHFCAVNRSAHSLTKQVIPLRTLSQPQFVQRNRKMYSASQETRSFNQLFPGTSFLSFSHSFELMFVFCNSNDFSHFASDEKLSSSAHFIPLAKCSVKEKTFFN